MNIIDKYIDGFIRWVRDHPRTKKIPIGPGGKDDPTYWRYFVIRRNPIFNLYLHRFLKDDEEHLHTHRMLNISFILQGLYFEERFVYKPVVGERLPLTRQTLVKKRHPLFRCSYTPHRVVLCRDSDGRPIPIWSLFIGFPQIRDWGFWVPNKDGRAEWIHYADYVSDPDPTSEGYGRPRGS